MKITSVILAILIFTFQAHAHFSLLDTADPLPENRYRVMLEPQIISGDLSGANVTARFDSPITNASGFRGILGVGALDFQAGAFYKWAPIPDVDNQPAMALLSGISYANYDGKDLFSVRVYPVISKRFTWELGEMKPYASLPFGMSSQSGKSLFPVQVSIGAELKFQKITDLDFFGEIGLEVKDSFSYISFGIATYFDEGGSFIKPIRTDLEEE